MIRPAHAFQLAAFGVYLALCAHAAPRKVHTVSLGSFRSVPYSRAGDPAGALPEEDSLRIRPLVVDGQIKEWTTGDSHDITDRSFVVRRVLRINDELPGDAPPNAPNATAQQYRWVWQRGPWLLVERVSGHVTALKLPDYDPGVSQVAWFRDYGAYCGVTSSGKSLYAVVAQLAARKPVIARKLSPYDTTADSGQSACAQPQWQRKPLQVTFYPAGKEAVSFSIVPGSAVLVEDSAVEPEAGQTAKTN